MTMTSQRTEKSKKEKKTVALTRVKNRFYMLNANFFSMFLKLK